MIGLFCADGERGVFARRGPAPARARGTKWQPPDTNADRCDRCGVLAWQHRGAG